MAARSRGARPLIRRREQTRQWHLEPWQERGLVRRPCRDDSLLPTSALVVDHGEGTLESVEDPVFRDARILVVLALIDVVALAVPPARRDEFHGDGGHVSSPVRGAAEASPDQTVGQTAAGARAYIL